MTSFHKNDTEAQKALRTAAFNLFKDFYAQCANAALTVDQHKAAMLTLRATIKNTMDSVSDPVYDKAFKDDVAYATQVAAAYNPVSCIMPMGQPLVTYINNRVYATYGV